MVGDLIAFLQVSDTAVESVPEIIKAAAQSPLGILALMVIAIAVLGYLFFGTASERTRIAMFILLLAGAAMFGAAAMKERPLIRDKTEPVAKKKEPAKNSDTPPNPTPLPPLIADSKLTRWTFRHAHEGKQVPGCDCGTNTVATDPPTVQGRKNAWVKFNWDVAWLCRGQGIKDSPEPPGGQGFVYWDGTTFDTLPGRHGTAEVKYSRPGSYPVRLTYSATCWDVNNGGERCRIGNKCEASGLVTIKIAD